MTARKPNPASMTTKQLAAALSKAYGVPIKVKEIRDAVKDGAPTNADGTVNLVRFIAWLLAKLKQG